jgi:hypothetical protein
MPAKLDEALGEVKTMLEKWAQVEEHTDEETAAEKLLEVVLRRLFATHSTSLVEDIVNEDGEGKSSCKAVARGPALRPPRRFCI